MDIERIAQTVTLRIIGSLDIEEALVETRNCISEWMPADEMFVFQMSADENDVYIICRITESGAHNMDWQLLLTLTDAEKQLRDHRFADSDPHFMVLRRCDMPSDISQGPMPSALSKFGLPSHADHLVLFDKKLNTGIGILSNEAGQYTEEHVALFTQLREPFAAAMKNAVRFYELKRTKERLEDENRALQNELQKEVGDRVVGMHHGLKQVMQLAGQVAKTLSPVLLLGETGSGKEVVATSIHRLSDRSDAPFVSLNCGAIPETLIDSELFGHEKGAFTGANERKLGRFERARGGTLFLDEVGELPPSAQVKLLRVIQEKEFERIGGNHSLRADVRLIAATNRDLPAMVRKGEFREDLWFRLNVFPIHIPPLRERREDIPSLAYFFLETRSRQLNLRYRPSLPNAELDKLVKYDWPGNVRELQNAIERALILSRGEPLQFPHLSSVFGVGAIQGSVPAEPVVPTWSTFIEMSRAYFESLLKHTNGRISGPNGAAAIADINPNTLRSKLKKLGLR
ncbi:MAG: sigma-54-dependent Fis family transcriptional regulator [Deltaproteobacteria bacterium]|nr:sigma-54-dependent Fis family transcriptional regulator [Deltaproteobacteria bacterium]MBN2672017.1 sigma-54-dependent Fis family transcriptional regulator [Deltaproteobacteria bacterium]